VSGPNQYTVLGQVDRTRGELEMAGVARGRVATTNAVETHPFEQHEFNERGRVRGGRIMIVTSKQARPVIEHAAATGELISHDVAQTIASWYQTPGAADEPITALSHGLAFDAAALYERLSGELRRAPADVPAEYRTEVQLLARWALARTPHLVVTTYELDADTWQAWSGQWGESDTEWPDGVTGSDEVFVIADWQRDLGDYLGPGEDGYPADTSGLEIDPDGSVIVPVSVERAAAAMIGGTHTGFYAQSYGATPFAPGEFWWQSDRFAEIGPDREYASRYIDPYTGAVQIKTGRLVGLSAEQQRLVWEAWKR